MTAREQGLRYVLVGAWNTLVGYVVFATLQLTLGEQIHYLIVLIPAQVVATLNAFVSYRLFVFKVSGTVLRDLARFSVVYVIAFVANLVALPLLVELAGIPVLLAQALVVSITVLTSFIAHRNFSFRRADPALEDRVAP